MTDGGHVLQDMKEAMKHEGGVSNAHSRVHAVCIVGALLSVNCVAVCVHARRGGYHDGGSGTILYSSKALPANQVRP